MNNQNMMMTRGNTGLIDAKAEMRKREAEKEIEEQAFVNSFETVNNGLMVRREEAPQQARTENTASMPEPPAPEKKLDLGPGQDAAAQSVQPRPKPKTKEDIANIASRAQADAKQQVTGGKPQAQNQNQDQSQDQNAAQVQNRDQVRQAKKEAVPAKIRTSLAPDVLAKQYVDMFKSHLGLDLSIVLCYENIRRICEPDIRDPLNTLYFIENTYRLSTLLYLAGNLPITIIATLLAEKNRKNVLRYVTAEIENAAKPQDDIRELRINRWAKKYEAVSANDAITVTPGATALTPELVSIISSRFDDICGKMRKFDKEFAKAVSKMDDAARNDVSYIYSNCWYFLQGFENAPEMRTYIMAITDDTRRNLKI